MDIGTPLGIIIGFGLILGSILIGGSLSAYIDIPSILIVVGGTIAATLISEKLPHVIGSAKVAMNAFKMPPGNVSDMVQRILDLSKIARREGVLALENEKVDEPFLAKGLRMAVDGVPSDEIRETLTAELVAMRDRHSRGVKNFKFMGATAPAMGMIGTLIGLVQMLQSLSDPASIGPAMAVALLTTMYGAVIAFLVCNPIAEKLDRRSKEESAKMVLVIEGIDSIAKGHNAAIIQEKLEARLSPKERRKDGNPAAAEAA